MKFTFRTVGSIAVPFIPIFLYYQHSTLALICLFVAVVCFIIWAILDRRSEKNKVIPQRYGGLTGTGIGTDEDTRLVIKAISDESDGFATFDDIARCTDLPSKTIKKALDWLFIHKFGREVDGLKGKAYILTPEGKSTFSQLINENINKPST